MTETGTEPIITDNNEQQVAPTATEIMANALWNMGETPYQNPIKEQALTQPEPPAQPEQPQPPAAPVDQPELIGLDEYFQREFGFNAVDFRGKWDELNKPKDTPPAQEHKWSYDDSKEEEIYNYINQKRQLDRLEKMEVVDDTHAAEILKANLHFKYKDTLSTQEIDRLFSKQYTLPPKPSQGIDQENEEYAAAVEAWENTVKERKMDMIIEAKMAKPDLLKFKSQIVLPEIQRPQVQQQGPTQEELQVAEAGRKAYLDAVGSDYQNFKGYAITAKSGDVQLPISYGISNEELVASKGFIENLNVDEFFGKRWFEGEKPRVNLIQEDLYLLTNREKIFQAIANEAVAKMADHLIKERNNINLTGVNPTLGPNPPVQPQQPKNTSQQVAEAIWAM